MKFHMLIMFIFIFFHVSTTVSAEAQLTAAFIRDHQLWIKTGEEEIQVTKNRYVQSPKWSFDGRFIAYIDGDEQGEKSDLYIYDTKQKESYQPYVRVVTSDFKWSPVKNQLAYTDQGLLNVTKMKDGRPYGFENVSLGVSGFEWFPNGKEFIASSQSALRPTGWGPIPLYKIPVDANLASEKMQHFYTIKTHEPDLFAIYAGDFKWSHDGKWVSFIAVPTASWSMDSNTLGVLSDQGDQFQVVGKMLGFKDWVKWAPSANQLAYISGEGRFFVENKKTKIADIPIFREQKEYTPPGFVDLGLEWYSEAEVIVARAKENKEWTEGPVPTMYTALYGINIKTGEQRQLTYPEKNELDEDPQVVGQHLTWVRRNMDKKQNDVWLWEELSGRQYRWIKNVESAPAFFTAK